MKTTANQSSAGQSATNHQVASLGARVWGMVVSGVRWYGSCLAGEDCDLLAAPTTSRSESPEAITPDARRLERTRRADIARQGAPRRVKSDDEPARRGHHTVARVSVAAGLLLVAATVLEHDRLAAHLRSLTGPNFEAPPFFTLEAFRALKAGMTEDEVRDSIGYPLERCTTAEATIRWYYTQPTSEHDVRFKLCVVAFSRDSRLLRQTKEVWHTRGIERLRTHVPMIPYAVGDIELVQTDGTALSVRADGPACLIVRNDSVSDLLGVSAKVVEVPGPPLSGMAQFFELQKDGATGVISADRRGVFSQTHPQLPDEYTRFSCAYSGGMVFSVPILNVCDPDTVADRAWLMRKLAASSGMKKPL